jgi:RluA family pseudouridine synthase
VNLSPDFQNLALYLDDALLVVNKPAGLPTLVDGYRPQAPHLTGLLTQIYGRVWVVHRLDKDTSGVIIFARSAQAHRELNSQFEQRRAGKVYHALVIGQPSWDQKTIDLALRPDGDRRHRTVVDPERGKPAVTRLRILERFRECALVEAAPLTGRTHQIRAHLAAAGYPLVADDLYHVPSKTRSDANSTAWPIDRLGLHAYSLAFFHPLSGQAQRVEAPYPPDFAQAVIQLRQHSHPD